MSCPGDRLTCFDSHVIFSLSVDVCRLLRAWSNQMNIKRSTLEERFQLWSTFKMGIILFENIKQNYLFSLIIFMTVLVILVQFSIYIRVYIFFKVLVSCILSFFDGSLKLDWYFTKMQEKNRCIRIGCYCSISRFGVSGYAASADRSRKACYSPDKAYGDQQSHIRCYVPSIATFPGD